MAGTVVLLQNGTIQLVYGYVVKAAFPFNTYIGGAFVKALQNAERKTRNAECAEPACWRAPDARF
jgi:hypothetical protein